MLSAFISNKRLDLILSLTLLLCISQMLLSWPLWALSSERSYPIIPVVDLSYLLDIKFSNTMLLFAAALATLGVFILKNKKLWLLSLLIICSFLIIIDVNRLQPWLFQYMLIWAAGVWAYRDKKGLNTDATNAQDWQNEGLYLIQMVFVATYLWAGLNKLNAHYLTSVFNWLMGIFEWSKFLKDNHFVAVLSVLIEIAVGIGLMFARTQRWAVLLGVLMHAIILILLVKDGWNKIVYPWNVGMAIGLWVLFWDKPMNINLGWLKQLFIAWVYTFLLFFAPVLNLFGLWQYNLSNMMYSGMSLEVEMVGLDEGQACFPSKFNNGKTYGVESDSSFNFDLDDWVMSEFEAPYYAETWIIPFLAKKYCPCLKPHKGFIRVETRNRWDKTKQIKIVACDEVKH